MNKKFQKALISLLMVFALCISVFAFGADVSLKASAQEASDGFTYTVNEEGTEATITGYEGTLSGHVSIPAHVGEENYGVTAISATAFVNNKEIISVEIPNGVVSIGESAFEGCSALEGIKLPSSLKEIGEGAFEATAITSVNIPVGTASIGRTAFRNCASLETVSVPATVEFVGDEAFKGTPWLDAQSDGLIYLGKVAYIYKGTMSDITRIEIKEGTTYITAYAFRNCDKLAGIVVPEGVTGIGNYAFAFCTTLEAVKLPESLRTLGEGVFQSCNELDIYEDLGGGVEYGVNIPEGIESVGESAFGGTKWYSSQPDGVVYVGNHAYKFKGEAPAETAITLKDGTASVVNGAFYNCTWLTEINIPSSTLKIGESAFKNCSALETLNLSEGLVSIGGEAFKDCVALKTLVIPDSVTYIGSGAFSGCRIENITMGNGLTSIPSTLISGGLKNIKISENVEEIADSAFAHCMAIESITLPSSVKKIGSNAFYYCIKLSEINFGGNVEFVGEGAFDKTPWYDAQSDGLLYVDKAAYKYLGEPNGEELVIKEGTVCICPSALRNVSGFKSITVADSVVSFSENSFTNCGVESFVMGDSMKTIPGGLLKDQLKSFVIGEGVAEIKENTFYGFSLLENITISDSVEAIGDCAFMGCGKIKEITIPDSVTTCSNTAFFATAIENVIMGSGLTEIPDGLISDYIKSIEIGENVEAIKKSAFENSNLIEKINLPSKIEAIGENAFKNASALKEINIPKAVKTIQKDAFDGCVSLEKAVIEDNASWCGVSLENEKSNPAYYTGALVIDGKTDSLVIDEAVETLNPYVFYNCSELKSVDLSNVKIIGKNAFEKCTGLSVLDVPSSVEVIGEKAFAGCNSISSLNLSEGLVSIFNSAFEGCSLIKDVTIPNSVTAIGQDAFLYCPLEAVVMGNGLKEIPVTLLNTNLVSFKVGDGVEKIPGYAFHDCSKLETIEMPDSVKEIGAYAFFDCVSLEEVKIPAGVTSLETGIFRGCKNLETVDFGNQARFTSVGANAFASTKWLSNQGTGVVYIGSVAYNYNGIMDNYTTVYLNAGTTMISPEAFLNCNGLEKIVIPASVSVIGERAFENCTLLSNIAIPDGVSAIEKNTFSGCSALFSITVPESVTEIKENAFAECVRISEVYYSGTGAQWSKVTIADGNRYLKNADVYLDCDNDCAHNFIVTEIDPTCDKAGKRSGVCSKCGANFLTVSAAIGHSYGEWETYRESTCQKQGENRRYCTNKNCEEFESEPKELADHSLRTGGVIMREPTCTDMGLARFYCDTGCGFYEEREIGVTGHADDNGDNLCDDCGFRIKDDCSCNCHKTGILSIIYKIIVFFWSIFGINPVCDCGVAHY